MFDQGDDRFIDSDFGPACDGDSGANCLYYDANNVPHGCPANRHVKWLDIKKIAKYCKKKP